MSCLYSILVVVSSILIMSSLTRGQLVLTGSACRMAIRAADEDSNRILTASEFARLAAIDVLAEGCPYPVLTDLTKFNQLAGGTGAVDVQLAYLDNPGFLPESFMNVVCLNAVRSPYQCRPDNAPVAAPTMPVPVPTQPVANPPVQPQPVNPPQTEMFPGCQKALAMADANDDDKMNFAEFRTLVDVLLQCPSSIEGDRLETFFENAVCLCPDGTFRCCGASVIDITRNQDRICSQAHSVRLYSTPNPAGCAPPTKSPTSAPTSGPPTRAPVSDRPTRAPTTRQPIVGTAAPTITRPTKAPVVPTNKPTTLPTRSPTLFPTVTPPTATTPCEQVMRNADQDGDRRLSEVEFTNFLFRLAECRPPTSSGIVNQLFDTVRCRCVLIDDATCCSTITYVDISVLYRPRTPDTIQYITSVCTLAYTINSFVGDTPGGQCPPTGPPVTRPTPLPVPSTLAPVRIPTTARPAVTMSAAPSIDPPTGVLGPTPPQIPIVAPPSAPIVRLPGTMSPTRSPRITNSPTPERPDERVELCLRLIGPASVIVDNYLTLDELTRLARALPGGCFTLSSAAALQFLFSSFDCSCPTDVNCCGADNVPKIDITGHNVDFSLRPIAQRIKLDTLCTSLSSIVFVDGGVCPAPTTKPTFAPSVTRTRLPTRAPRPPPTRFPTRAPKAPPTSSPTQAPVPVPTESPLAFAPILLAPFSTGIPTQGPAEPPTLSPIIAPTIDPPQPVRDPVASPIFSPRTQNPTSAPDRIPIDPLQPEHGPTLPPIFNPKSESPTTVPVKLPTVESKLEPSLTAPVSPPTSAPTAPISPPTSVPIDAPRPAPTAEPVLGSDPVSRPVFAPLFVAFSLQDCVDAVRAADVDRNTLLGQEEYLQLVVILSGCNLITALSEAQFDLFTELACLCEKDPRFVAGCCSANQRKVLVDQDEAIQNVCVKTRSVIAPGCVQSPTNPVDPSLPAAGPGVVPSVVSPASPPLSLPAIGPSAPALFPDTMLAFTPTIAGAVPRTKAPIALISESLECQDFLDQSNGRLTYEGFLAFVNHLSGCRYDGDSLPIPLRSASVRLSQADIIDLVGRADPGFVSRRAQVCYEIIEGIGGTTCQEDQPLLSEPSIKIPQLELDSCASSIKEVDANGDELLDKDEFHHFLSSYGDCTLQELDYGHIVAFYNFACKLPDYNVSDDDRELCGFPNPATVNLSGVNLPVDQRSESQARRLTQVCDVAIGLTANRTCEVLPQVPDPVLGDSECSALIVQADVDANQRLSRSEYLRFIQLSDDGCADYLALPTYHTYIFGLLSCACIFEGGGIINPFCCMFEKAVGINIAGANSTVDERSDYQKSTIAVLCEVTRVAAEFGCLGNAAAVQRGTTAVNTSFLLVPASSSGSAMRVVVFSSATCGAMAMAALFTLLF